VEDAGCEQENWQSLHPSCWTNNDVLDFIFYVASKWSCGEDAVRNIRGEKFQGVDGRELYRMKVKDFLDRDPRYGKLLFDCVQELRAESEDLNLFYNHQSHISKKFSITAARCVAW